MNISQTASTKSPDFRLFLQQELAKRCGTNPKYSLRAFAKFLGITPAFLSNLLKGKRSVTQSSIEKFSERLGLRPDDLAKFQNFHFKGPRSPRSSGTRKPRPKSIPDFNQVHLDQFEMISDWYHYAILELIRVRGFDPSPRWMAKALSVNIAEVHAALERLERLGMISRSADGKIQDTSKNYTTTGNPSTAVAFRNLQKGVLQKAIVALEELPIEKRDQTSLTMALDSKLIPKLKLMLKDFRKQLVSLQDESKDYDQVYHLSFSVYPILSPSLTSIKGVRK